ncbi:AAA family ATPase [Methylobacterium nonmethylotrophicum]|uniref:AAA family ATPase n=1 Tax=Methylobacterium nonmethylotrophicum TaxID=1141884 RepID=A0A4Z0NS21_9HYPH|nr:AAA family ATPase [Methylobacterium nonmethylotrophicum]TGD99748.1 AAA family ATPase [Methylobacterium nonmethylotrophicum]
MKKPLRAAFAPTRELYACTASLIADSVAQDGAAWVRHTLATGPELDIATRSWTDPVVLPFLRGVERSFADCRNAGETPAAKEMLSERIVDYLRLGHDVLVDDDGFDRPLMPGALARLAYYGVSYGALMAKPYAQDALIDMARLSPPGDAIHYVAYGLALMTDAHPHFAMPNDFSTRDVCLVVPAALALGLEHLPGTTPAAAAAAPLDEEERLDIEEDRAGIVRWRQAPPPRPRPKAEPVGEVAEPAGPGAVIFPETIVERHKPDLRRDIKAALGLALGAHLRHVPVPRDWSAWTRERLEAFPWMGEAIEAFRELQGNREHFGGGVLGLVGTTGCGKSALAAELITSSGLHLVRYNADAASENSFLGTPARWVSAHLGIPEKALADAMATSAGILADELEKASGSRNSNGGRLHDGLHGVWEAETARAWHSQFLLHPVDVSGLVYVCTMNEDTLPASLRDRMKIVRVPEPGPEHLGVLAPRLARAVCRETGQDERFGELDGDEISALADAWRGGSIRRLRRLVETVLRAREGGPAAMPRH